MNLAQALKQKNRLAGELVRQQQILTRENARRSDMVSTVDREAVWNRIQQLSEELGELKGKITTANIGIYSLLERMAELKSRISYVQSLPKREGEEITFVGRDQEKLVYKWDTTINQVRCDELVAKIQTQINELQDKVDAYNAVTTV
jgi:chromosome segregation ATPase